MLRCAFALLLGAAALLLPGCVRDTLNVGPGISGGPTGPMPEATLEAPNGWHEDQTATLTVIWTYGRAPYTIGCNMGGGTTEDVPPGTPAVSPFTHEFTLIEGTWFYTITVTDSTTWHDLDGLTGTTTGAYTVGPPLNHPPAIDDVTFEGSVLTVYVSDPDGDSVDVELIGVPELGLMVDGNRKIAGDYSKEAIDGVATFELFSTDILMGVYGTITIIARDEHGAEDQTTFEIAPDPLVVPEGALVAVPSMGAAAVGGEVTINVISGDFPAGASFNYMNGVGVKVEEGAEYVDGTLNVGAVGGEQKDSDGLWAGMSPTPGSYLLPDDFMIVETPVDGEAGMIFIGFNVTPIGGGDVTAGGVLFNFGMTFTAAGTYNLSFIEFQDVKRTYYSDSTSAEFNWTDISNQGVPNTIDVT